ncbi:MAG: AAA family ATPase [Candidatus Scatomorpha sp.]|jgi:CO dehydrogenase maturation factor
MEKKKALIIALAGKGGVGKTSVAASMVRVLIEAYPGAKILAIDADPAVGLSTALGVKVESSLDDIRRAVIKSAEDGRPREAIELLEESRFRIFDTMVETKGFSFLAIGRPENEGCYCSVNAYLKEVVSMLANDFDFVVIDGEAGIEQIQRRVMERVTHLVLVSDQSRKGTRVTESIKKVADELVMYERVGVVINRVTNPELNKYIEVEGAEILAFIDSDDSHAANDIRGMSVFELAPDSNMLKGVREALRNLKVLK